MAAAWSNSCEGAPAQCCAGTTDKADDWHCRGQFACMGWPEFKNNNVAAQPQPAGAPDVVSHFLRPAAVDGHLFADVVADGGGVGKVPGIGWEGGGSTKPHVVIVNDSSKEQGRKKTWMGGGIPNACFMRWSGSRRHTAWHGANAAPAQRPPSRRHRQKGRKASQPPHQGASTRSMSMPCCISALGYILVLLRSKDDKVDCLTATHVAQQQSRLQTGRPGNHPGAPANKAGGAARPR